MGLDHVPWVYVMISNVVLVNLLIAMMWTRHNVKEHANREWMFERLGSTLEMVERMMWCHRPFPSDPCRIILLVDCSRRLSPLLWEPIQDKNTQEDGTSKPAQWAAGGNLWTVKVRAHERTQRAMLDYNTERERAVGSGSARQVGRTL